MGAHFVRRIGALAVALVIFTLFAAAAFAEEETIAVPGTGVSVTLDTGGDIDIITRETPPDAPIFARLGLDGEEMLQRHRDNNMYLEIIDWDNVRNYTFVQQRIPADADPNWDMSTDEQLKDLFMEMQTLDAHFSASDPSIHKLADGTRLVQMDVVLTHNGAEISARQYFLIRNSHIYAISCMMPGKTAPSEADYAAFSRFVDGFAFPPPTGAGSEPSVLESALYTGFVSGLIAAIATAVVLLFRRMRAKTSRADSACTPAAQAQTEPAGPAGPAPASTPIGAFPGPAPTDAAAPERSAAFGTAPPAAPHTPQIAAGRAACPLCGARLSPGAQICPGCGTRLD